MTGLLLQTKLFKPVPRPSLVPRPHLINQLNDGLGTGDQGFSTRLTLVSAPAGLGKTTLVAGWLAQLATGDATAQHRLLQRPQKLALTLLIVPVAKESPSAEPP